jgi:hypothetical protein
MQNPLAMPKPSSENTKKLTMNNWKTPNYKNLTTMKKANFNLILGVFLAFAVCMMTSCKKIDDITNQNTGVVVDDGLFCYFDFDDEEVVDWQGNYIGINSGTTTSTDTPSGEGKSRQFNGNSLLFIEDNIVPSGSSYTINLWFKTETNAQYLLGTDVLYLDWPCYSLNLTESSCINYIADSPIYPTTTNNPISNYLDNQWHMLTISVVNNGNLAMIYLDGVLFESTQSYGNNGWSWGSNVTMTFIGSAVNNNHAGKFNGKLDNFRSYNRALTAQEVQTLYNAKQ